MLVIAIRRGNSNIGKVDTHFRENKEYGDSFQRKKGKGKGAHISGVLGTNIILHHHFRRKEEKGTQTSGETIGKWGTAHISREIFGQGKKGHTVNHVEINVFIYCFC